MSSPNAEQFAALLREYILVGAAAGVLVMAYLIYLVVTGRDRGRPALTVPDVRFHRRVGRHAKERLRVDGTLANGDYEAHLRQSLPTPDDEAVLAELFEREWIAPRGAA